MTEFLLDTNHVGAVLRQDQRVLARIASLQDAELCVCMPSVGELWFMVYNSARAVENASRLNTLLSQLRIVDSGMVAANEYGKVRTELKQQGRPIPQIDIQIAATARVGKFVLVTSDAHFRFVSGLAIEDWRNP